MNLNKEDKLISVRIPRDVYDRLDHIAEQNWTNMSSVVREGIRKEIDANLELFQEKYFNSHHNRTY